MQGMFPRRLLAVIVALAVVSGLSAAGEIHSTMRNVNAVMEAHGFRISPVYDVEAPAEAGDLAPVQVFEIERPFDKPVTIGRLFTSCSCIQLETHKRTFKPGERAVLYLRNIKPTPQQGQLYAIFVQITSPVRTTLRFDTFVQTGSGAKEEPETPETKDDAEQDSEGEDNPESEVEGTASIVQDVVADAGKELQDDENEADAESASLKPPLLELPAGTEISESIVDLANDIEDAAEEKVGALNQRIGEGADAALDAMDSYFQSNEPNDPKAAGPELGGDIPDFYAQTQTMPIVPPANGGNGVQPPSDPANVAPASLTPPAPVSPPPVAEPEPAPMPTPAATIAAPAPTTPPPAPAQESASLTPPPRDPAARKPVQAVSLITIGVRDMPASIRFYEALGWRRAARGKYDQTAFFQLQGQILALYPINDQLQEQNMVGATPSPGGITLALHVSEKADVWAVYQRFIDAGGSALRPPAELPSGAVSSYVADPDGNPWEISWVPQFRIDDEGGLWLP